MGCLLYGVCFGSLKNTEVQECVRTKKWKTVEVRVRGAGAGAGCGIIDTYIRLLEAYTLHSSYSTPQEWEIRVSVFSI